MDPDELLLTTEERMEKAVEVLKDKFRGMRTGRANAGLVEPLTDRELEVLQLIAEGLTNQQIAEELVISVGTAKWYTGQIYGKLTVSNRTQAVARARELNIIS